MARTFRSSTLLRGHLALRTLFVFALVLAFVFALGLGAVFFVRVLVEALTAFFFAGARAVFFFALAAGFGTGRPFSGAS